MLLAVPGRRWEHKLAVRPMRMLAKLVDEFQRGRNLTIFPSLRVESQFRFRGHPPGPQLEVHVAPAQEHHLLLAETGQQKRGEQGAFRIGARCKEARKLLVAVYLHKWRDALGERQLFRDPAPTMALEKLRDDDRVVQDRVGSQAMIFLEC